MQRREWEIEEEADLEGGMGADAGDRSMVHDVGRLVGWTLLRKIW